MRVRAAAAREPGAIERAVDEGSSARSVPPQAAAAIIAATRGPRSSSPVAIEDQLRLEDVLRRQPASPGDELPQRRPLRRRDRRLVRLEGELRDRLEPAAVRRADRPDFEIQLDS